MKKLGLQITALAAGLIILCILARFAAGNDYTVYIPIHSASGAMNRLDFPEGEPELVEFEDPHMFDGYMQVRIKPREPGNTFAEIKNQAGVGIHALQLHVGRFMTVYDDNTGGFTGDTIVLAGFTLFCLLSGALMLRFFLNQKGPKLYSYNSMYTSGFSFMLLIIGFLMLYLTLRRIITPAQFTMYNAYLMISSASFTFMRVTLPFVVVFAVMMAVSNIELLRHERRRLANVLGILISVLLLAGEAVAFLLYRRDFYGSLTQMRIHETIQNVYATVFAYFECMLLGAVICSFRAIRQKPVGEKDYIIILGCGFRKDGSLPPLLRGRVDKAIDFWKKQQENGGKRALLIPSGGQGPDEVMSESEAMKRYMTGECGIPEESILQETQSKNTYQNMLFSKKIINETDSVSGHNDKEGNLTESVSNCRTVFSTTNYHVFRSGIWAGLAGLEAEGIGSRTKWWFWPNAFIRECIGLMRNRILQELLLLIMVTAFFGAISLILIR